jgi:ribosomal protein L37E
MEGVKQIQDLLKLAAKNVLVIEEVPEYEALRRYAICEACPSKQFNAKKKTCKICGCFMEVKTKARVHRTKKFPQGQITHCPAGHWGEQEKTIIAFYENNTDFSK